MSTGHLLHLLVVDVGDVGVGAVVALVGTGGTAHVVGVEAGTGVTGRAVAIAGTTGLLLGIVHVLRGSLPSLVHLLHSGVNLGDVAGAASICTYVQGYRTISLQEILNAILLTGNTD